MSSTSLSVKQRVIQTVTRNVPKVDFNLNPDPLPEHEQEQLAEDCAFELGKHLAITATNDEAAQEALKGFAEDLSAKLDEVIPDTRVLRFELPVAQANDRLRQIAPHLLPENQSQPQPEPVQSVQTPPRKLVEAMRDYMRNDRENRLNELLAASELGISVQAYRHFTEEIRKVRAMIGATQIAS